MPWRSKESQEEEQTEIKKPKRMPIKNVSVGILWFIGISVGVAHIGVLGHLINLSNNIKNPIIQIPNGKYASYELNVNKDGYTVRYRADDPKILNSERSLKVDRTKKGLFGGGSDKRDEYRRDEYTAEGYRNLQGGASVDGEGKSAKDIECIVADAGARSQGAMAGSSIAAGAIIPAVIGIPYIGWLAAGWATLLGQKVGSEIGSEVGSVFNDC
jgi:hypothetical protein